MRLLGLPLIVVVLLMGLISMASADVVLFDENFDVATAPVGWTLGGFEQGSHTTPGIVLPLTHQLGTIATPYTFLQLTDRLDNDWERSWAYFDTPFNAGSIDGFELTAKIRITTNGTPLDGDGLTFAFIRKDKSTSGQLSVTDLIGGYGQYQGVPRNAGNPGDTIGIVPGVQGYAFEFDHFRNTGNITDPNSEYTDMRILDNWATRVPGSFNTYAADPTFYTDGTWHEVKLTYNPRLAINQFTFAWDSMDAAHSYSWTGTLADDPDGYYFGFTGSTGAQQSSHDIDDAKLTITPEPGTIALLALGLPMGLAWVRRRKQS